MSTLRTDTLFCDRNDAGQQLAEALCELSLEEPLILALPRGGVPIAHQVSKRLGAPMDLLLVRKIGMPGNPEFGLGAVAENGIQVIDKQAVHATATGEIQLQEAIEKAQQELVGQVEKYRSHMEPLPISGRTVVIVDDGLATGGTAIAASLAAKEAGARNVVIAVPVGSEDVAQRLESYADEVVCLYTPHPLYSVGMWYDDFSQVEDKQVTQMLQEATHFNNEQQVSESHHIQIPGQHGAVIQGDMVIPIDAVGLVIFAHGSGSSRHSLRNRHVAAELQRHGLGTMLIDLLSEGEEQERKNVFDINLLASRLMDATQWTQTNPMTQRLPIGYFGASTGAGAALVAAAQPGNPVRAIVSRGGRPDMAGSALEQVRIPVLLIVGGDDHPVIELNEWAADQLGGDIDLKIIPGATHLFEEPGTLEQVAQRSIKWFLEHLPG